MSDIDILAIDKKIIDNFNKESDNIDNYKSKLEELFKTKNNVKSLSNRVNFNLQNEISSLQNKIDDIIYEKSRNFYIMETTNILSEYKKELKAPIAMSFMGKVNTENINKLKLIDQFIQIASKYININFPEKKTNRKEMKNCVNCNKNNFDITDNCYICNECGTVVDLIIHQSSYRDVERVNITTKYTYDPKIHFRDCINQFQGKQNATIEQKVYDDIIRELKNHQLLIGDENTPKKLRFSKITKEHVYHFLKETKHSKHYEDIILIYYNITGHKPDNISHLEQILLDDFDTLTTLYDQVYRKDKKIERKNFINTQYVLFQLLKRHKYPCKKEDFNILKTIDRQSFHDEICKVLFEKLGWNFTAIF
jgi:polyhydroxyalkanoate synthesis regulator phasin